MTIDSIITDLSIAHPDLIISGGEMGNGYTLVISKGDISWERNNVLGLESLKHYAEQAILEHFNG
jgi:hypothetical protein